MEIFVRVVESGGFSAAARRSNMTPSAVSKLVGRLETRLGSRLINRSTRQFQLTAEGCSFYENAVRILADIEDAERHAGAGEAPRGLVRVNTSASYANHILAPLLPRFLDAYPGISVELVLTDMVVDLVAERADIAIRAGPMVDSRLIARKLGETALAIVGSPAYFERHGVPATAGDLEHHGRLGFGYRRAVGGWTVPGDHGPVEIPAVGRVSASDGEALRHLAIAGAGLARLAGFSIAQDLAEGRLVAVLDTDETRLMEAFHAVYIGQGGPLPQRVRVLLDFLAEHGQVS